MTGRALGPIGDDEIPVAQLITEVHLRFCSTDRPHDAGCNTLRRLTEDHQALAAARRPSLEGTRS